MKLPVMLSIRGRQCYEEAEPEVIELVTPGTLEEDNGGWNIVYQETDLTGMEGVTTAFRAEPDKVILTRTGNLSSQMVFQKGVAHDSLYQMPFGALLITVCATDICWNITEAGGTVDLVYRIEIENSAAGTVKYHLDIMPVK